MRTNKQNETYTRVVDGYLCTFNSKDHIFRGALLATGMDVKKWEEFEEKMQGQIDPKYKET